MKHMVRLYSIMVIRQLIIKFRFMFLLIRHIKLVIRLKHQIIKELVSGLFIFQQLSIQFFQLFFLKEYIQYIYLNKLMECIRFNIQLHSNQSLFFPLVHIQLWQLNHIQLFFFLLEFIQLFKRLRIQFQFFHKEHIQFLIILRVLNLFKLELKLIMFRLRLIMH